MDPWQTQSAKKSAKKPAKKPAPSPQQDVRARWPGTSALNQKQLAMLLIWLGAVPFVVLALLVALAETPRVFPAAPALILHVYAVIIASFVAGLHWGIHFCKRTGESVYLHSGLVALLLWASLLSAGTAVGLVFVLVGFILLWVIEYRFSLQRVTTAWFWRLRSLTTAFVSGCLLVAIVFV